MADINDAGETSLLITNDSDTISGISHRQQAKSIINVDLQQLIATISAPKSLR